MERSDRNITKAKPSLKSRKNKQKNNAIISRNKNRREIIKINIVKETETETEDENEGPNPRGNL